MINEITYTQVNGEQYNVWSDFIKRGTFAKDKNGVVKQISYNGYVSNDLTVRKSIQMAFQLDTFRKNTKK